MHRRTLPSTRDVLCCNGTREDAEKPARFASYNPSVERGNDNEVMRICPAAQMHDVHAGEGAHHTAIYKRGKKKSS